MTAGDPYRGREETLRARITKLAQELAEADAEIERLERACEAAEAELEAKLGRARSS